jgi:hypothetical protein
MFVLNLDQRASSAGPDLVAEWADGLNHRFENGLLLPFSRAAGDEIQALASSAEPVVDIVLEATRSEQWWVGVGLGAVEHVGGTPRHSRGLAFRAARVAADEAKRSRWRCAVRGEPLDAAAWAEDCFALLVFLRDGRSERAWELVDRAANGQRTTDIARDLEISKQAVSKQLRAAGFVEEQRGRNLAASILEGAWNRLS